MQETTTIVNRKSKLYTRTRTLEKLEQSINMLRKDQMFCSDFLTHN